MTPKASRTAVIGMVDEAGGQRRVLKVAVTAAPEGGRANDAVARLLAREWRVPRSSIEVLSGANSRAKTLLVTGDGTALLRRLSAWAAERL